MGVGGPALESLREVSCGDPDIAVGISGFGSARVGVERWQELARLTGRTTYYLQYDAQELPWADDEYPSMDVYWEVMGRWKKAREGAIVAADYLAEELVKWARDGKKILVVGFSLGAYAGWLAIQKVPPEYRGQIEFVMLSAAIGDTVKSWSGLEDLASVVNGYSVYDMALRYIYPEGVDTDETPAAGLGPLIVTPLPNLTNVDMTDMIGWDHLWGSRNMPRLVSVALGCLWGARPAPGVMCAPLELPAVVDDLSSVEVGRLLRWTVVDESLWLTLARALDGDPVSTHRMRLLDAWTLQDGRLLSLVDAGATIESLQRTLYASDSATRSRAVLAGILRHWISRSPDLEEIKVAAVEEDLHRKMHTVERWQRPGPGKEKVLWRTGDPITFEFSRNTEKAPFLGEMYAQNIEPAGRYIVTLEVYPKDLPLGWDHGEVTFTNPLVLASVWPADGRYAGEEGWKARLSSAFDGLIGVELSRALLGIGHDGIVTVSMSGPNNRPGYISEIVDLRVIDKTPGGQEYREVQDEGFLIYRVGDHLGPGSFWAETEAVARRYGGGGELHTRCVDKQSVLTLATEADALDFLSGLGFSEGDAYALLSEGNDWMMYPEVLPLLREQFDWVRQRIEADGPEIEWIYLGTE